MNKYMKKRYIIAAAAAVFLLIASAVVITATDKSSVEYLSVLSRPDRGEADREYELEVLYGGRQNNITVYIGQAALGAARLEELFCEAWEVLERKLLGDNSSADNITQKVELVSELPGYNMSVEWYIDNREVIDSWGDIHRAKEPRTVCLTAALTYKGEATEDAITSREHTYELTVQPYTREQEEEQMLYELISEADRKYCLENEVALPDIYEGQQILYRRRKEQEYIKFLALAVLIPVLLYAKHISDKKQKKKKLEEEYIREYPEIISKLSLLIGAGMTPYNALVRISSDGQGEAYTQIRNMVRRIQSGKAERMEYADFGRIFGIHCYSKLGTMLEQNMVRGNERLREMLKNECMEALEERKARARKAGEQAGTMLLMPMMMMLVVVMVIIMVPAFMSF